MDVDGPLRHGGVFGVAYSSLNTRLMAILPGDEIYRSPPPPTNQPNYVGGAVTSPPISVFEVDGKKAKVSAKLGCVHQGG